MSIKKHLPTIIIFIIIIGVIALGAWLLFDRENSIENSFLANLIEIFKTEKEEKIVEGLAKIINLHSHPQQGENWIVSFETYGTADLKIIPTDQATIEDDEFVALYCGEEERKPQILDNDVIYYPNWQCSQKVQVIHYTKKAGKHTLKFVFGNSEFFAYNSAVWYHPKWGYRKKITIQDANVDGDLTDFPLYVDITSDADIGAHAQADGDDIRFTTDDGITVMPHEEESFTVSAGSATGDFWVKVPTINNATTTDIYIYYGNPDAADGQQITDVWDSSYKMVQHMTGAAYTDLDDSTLNNSDVLTEGGDPVYDQTGQIHNAVVFDGTGDYVDVGDKSVLDFGSSTDFTASAWIKTTAEIRTDIMGKGDGQDSGDKKHWEIFTWTDGTFGIFIDDDTNTAISYDDGTVVNDGEWHFVMATCSRTGNLIRYVDGLQTGSTSVASGVGDISSSEIFAIGKRGNKASGDHFNGTIDEVRITNDIRTANEIKFEHANINESDNELDNFAAQETYSAPSYIRWKGGTHFKGGTIFK